MVNPKCDARVFCDVLFRDTFIAIIELDHRARSRRVIDERARFLGGSRTFSASRLAREVSRDATLCIRDRSAALTES